MTILSVAQAACQTLGLQRPDTLLTNTDRTYTELLEIAQEMAQRIASGYDWQVLKGIHTLTGDGANEDFALPSNYDRMLQKAQVWSSSLETALTHIPDSDKWLGLDVQSFDYVINAWTIYGGQMRIKPALGSGVTAKYFYITNKIVTAGDGVLQTEFVTDQDSFRIDDRLLKLGIIWRWREVKGIPYAESMQDYEEEKARLVARDKGSRVVRMGTVRLPIDTRPTYPKSIAP